MEHIKRLEKTRQEGATMEVGQSTTPPPMLGASARRSSNDGANARSVKDQSTLNGRTPVAKKYGSAIDKSPSTFTTAATTKSTPPAWLASKSAKPGPTSSDPEAAKTPIASKYGYSVKSASETGKTAPTTPSSGRTSKLAEPSSKSSKLEDVTKSGSKPIYSLPKKSTTESSTAVKTAETPKSFTTSNKYPYALPSKATNDKSSPPATTSSKLKKPDPPSPSKSSKKKAASLSKKPDPPLKDSNGNSTKSTLPTVTLKPTNSAAAAELKRQKEEEEQEALAKSLSNISTSSQRKSSLPPPGSMKQSSKKAASVVESKKEEGKAELTDGAINDHVKRLRQTTGQSQPKDRADDGADPYLDNYLKRVGDQRQKAEQVVKKQPDEPKKNKKSVETKKNATSSD